jgi:hypothetical protein
MNDIETPEPRSTRRRLTIALTLLALLLLAVVAAFWILAQPSPPQRDSARRIPGEDQPRPETPAAARSALEPAPPAAAGPSARRMRSGPALAPAPEAPPAGPTTGTLSVESDVPGAMVFLDREFKGNAPVVIDGVAPGSHHLNLSADGYDSYSEPVDILAGPNNVAVRFKEVKLNEAIKVVHKHTLGSCVGRLIADPQGLRYETSNKNDSFALTFADIETFEVDYLNKNLRIKQRGGRTYNFTGDSADALFVFHKNVQKARERLAKGDPPAPAQPK